MGNKFSLHGGKVKNAGRKTREEDNFISAVSQLIIINLIHALSDLSVTDIKAYNINSYRLKIIDATHSNNKISMVNKFETVLPCMAHLILLPLNFEPSRFEWDFFLIFCD